MLLSDVGQTLYRPPTVLIQATAEMSRIADSDEL